jgi:hypothetical protein
MPPSRKREGHKAILTTEPCEVVVKQAGQAARPPSDLLPPIFMIGRDSGGHWVAQEQGGLHGGLFLNRAAAMKYAKFESGNYPRAVVIVSGVLELDASGASAPGLQQPRAEIVPRRCRVA